MTQRVHSFSLLLINTLLILTTVSCKDDQVQQTTTVKGTAVGEGQTISGHVTKGPVRDAAIIAKTPQDPSVLLQDLYKVVGTGVVQQGQFTFRLVQSLPEGAPIFLEVSGGTYDDEVSGRSMSLSEPLQLFTQIRNNQLEFNSVTLFSTLAAALVVHYVHNREGGIQKAIEQAHADVATHFGLPQDFQKRIPIDLRKSAITAELKKKPEFRMALLQEALYRVAQKIHLSGVSRFVQLLFKDLSDGRFDSRNFSAFISDPEGRYQWSQLLTHPVDRSRISSALFDFIRDCQEGTISSFQQHECIPSLKMDDISLLFDPLSTQASPLICEHVSREYTVISVPQSQAVVTPIPVSAAGVRLLAAGGKLLYETKTDPNGHFTLKQIKRPDPLPTPLSSDEKIRLEIESPTGKTYVKEVPLVDEPCVAGWSIDPGALDKTHCVTCDPVMVLDSQTIDIGDPLAPSSCAQVDVILIPYQLRDNQGAPLPNALLSITLPADVDQTFAYQITTDGRGEFLLSEFGPPFDLIRSNFSDSSRLQLFPYEISLEHRASGGEPYLLQERINILMTCPPTTAGCPMPSCRHEIVREPEPGRDPQIFNAGIFLITID